MGRPKKPMTADDVRHGTVNGYGNLRCRCGPCRDAWRARCSEAGYLQRYRSKIRSRETPTRYHGTHTGYTNYGCRCEMCRGIPRGQTLRLKWKRASLTGTI